MGELSPPSRRAFLGRAAGTAGAAAAGLTGAGALAGCARLAGQRPSAGRTTTARPARQVSAIAWENSLPGETRWWIQHVGAPGAIEGYAGQASVLRGDPVTLHVSTTSPRFQVTALRMGWYDGLLARRVWQSKWLPGHRQPAYQLTAKTRTVSCAWEPSVTIPTADFPPGTYLLRLDSSRGPQRYVPLTVRTADMAGKVVIKNAVATWQAYNTWGGYDLFAGPRGYADRSFAVSLDRPYDSNGASSFLAYERKLIALAERLSLPLAYVTGIDIDANPHLLDGVAALISPGHDAYWSPAERAQVTAARNAGVNIAFFGANAVFRRIRVEPTLAGPGRLIVCYSTSYQQDPMYGRNDALVTSAWRDRPDPEPECSLTGTMYEANPATAAYVVTSPDSWVFAGTGAREGTSIKGLVGAEYDRVNPFYPVPRPIQVLSHSPLTCQGTRSYGDSAYYTQAGGAGVFSAGTTRWVQSLAAPFGRELSPRAHAFTGRVTANVLRAFAGGPAAAAYPARDNLAGLHEWAGDPIAAKHNLWPPVIS